MRDVCLVHTQRKCGACLASMLCLSGEHAVPVWRACDACLVRARCLLGVRGARLVCVCVVPIWCARSARLVRVVPVWRTHDLLILSPRV